MRHAQFAFVLFASLALAACDRTAAEPTPPNLPPLKSVAPAPFGAAIKAMQIDDPDWVALARAQVSQLTPEWEMKMEYIVGDDGGFRFDTTMQGPGLGLEYRF